MTGRDRKDGPHRQGGTEWFIDFEQGDDDLEALAEAARRRRRESSSPKPRRPHAKPKAPGPSPWVADFLLNQVEAAGRAPRAAPRKPSSAKADGTGERNLPAPADSGDCAADARGQSALEERAAKRREADAKAPRAAIPPPHIVAETRSGPSRGGTRSYAPYAVLLMGLAGGLLALLGAEQEAVDPNVSDAPTALAPPGSRQAAPPSGSSKPWLDLPSEAARIVQPDKIASAEALPLSTARLDAEPTGLVSTEPVRTVASPASLPVQFGSSKPWLDVPSEAARILRPERTVSTEPFPISTARVEGDPIQFAPTKPAPKVTSSASAPEAIGASPEPRLSARIDPRPMRTVVAKRSAIEVAARDVPVIPDDPSPEPELPPVAQRNDRVGTGSNTPLVDQAAREAQIAAQEGPKRVPPRSPSLTSRRGDKRQEGTKLSPPRVAQAPQPRSFALPAALRPTSF